VTPFNSIILGLVEGITEFLPISSTAHLVLTADLLGFTPSSFLSSFIIAIQLGAILSVVCVYSRKILDIEVWKRVFLAFLPTALIGFVLYKTLKVYLIENIELIAWALLLGGVIILVFERFETTEEKEREAMPYMTAFWLGCIQALAIIPGVSRAGATIVGGRLLGVSREDIVEFSFLLAVPTMLAATTYDLLKSGGVIEASEWHLLALGFGTAFIAAYLSIRFLLLFVRTHTFRVFAWYRIVLGGGLLLWMYFLAS
jgi:undecaprenyl-diphosphatase